jgi:hypothetical protein
MVVMVWWHDDVKHIILKAALEVVMAVMVVISLLLVTTI